MESPVICAWCPDFDPKRNPAGASHGICAACRDRMDRMIFDAMKRPTRLAPRPPKESDDDA